MSGDAPVLVIGAGVAGLSCASALVRRGVSVHVLDRGRGVGGRCATWRAPGGLPLDYGVGFLHGEQPEFWQAITRPECGEALLDWPRLVEGSGTPCQPRVFDSAQRRLALVDGLSAFPKALARSVPVQRSTEVAALELRDDVVEVRLAQGDAVTTSCLVLAMPARQMLRLLLGPAQRTAAVASVCAVLETFVALPSLSVLATYDRQPPPWELALPAGSPVLQSVSNETSKRPAAGRPLGLVLQSRPGWAKVRLDGDPAEWSQEMLAEGARLYGDWVAAPAWWRAHRWSLARTDDSARLRGPLWIRSGGVRLGLAGEFFAPGAGVEAAWLSGQRLADQLGGDG